MIHDDGISNDSGNRPFEEVLDKFRQRRRLLQGGIAAAAAFMASGPAQAATPSWARDRSRRPGQSIVNFVPVPLAGGGGLDFRVSPNYTCTTLIPWGDPLFPGSTETVGIGHDGMTFFPLDGKSNTRGLLAINHEYGENIIVLGKNTPSSLDDVRASQYAHGVSVVEIWRDPIDTTRWFTANTKGVARRIHVNTPMAVSGPVAGSPLLANPANNPVLGTLNNCANGETPWGTYLTCEENFNGYFGARSSWTANAMQRRYGFSANGFGYGWHLFDERFDLSNPAYVNEANRFGWIVEIDPFDGSALPVKRTALGRFKHEGIAIVEGKGGRIVGYMGDDERFDYIYKFVSDGNWKSMRARGQSPLDHGKLYAARFNEDGSGNWLELTIDNPVLAAQFSSQAEVLTFARRAADLLGATPMDRPEWATVGPNGIVYCTLTNNTNRGRSGLPGAVASNPLAPNRDGHIIRWLDSDQHVGLTFVWDIFVMAAETHGTEASFASPDGLWADPDGRLFIQTDGSQQDGLNDQMLVADINTGRISRLLEGVSGCEVTGIALTPDRKTLFCNLQHPDPDTSVGRDITLVLTRKGGGVVGS